MKTLYMGGNLGSLQMFDWYSDNGYAPRSNSSSSKSSSSRSSSSNKSSSSSSSYGGPTAYNMRDYMSGYGQTPDWNASTGTVTIGGNAYKVGSIPGTYFDAGTNTHYVTDTNAFNSILGAESPDSPTQQPNQPYQPYQPYQQQDMTAYINQLKEAQRQSRINALEKARVNALSDLDTYKTGRIAAMDTAKGSNLTSYKNALDATMQAYDTEGEAITPFYYDKRNQAAAASDVGAMNFANYMAARGIKGAAGAMPEIYRNASLQGQIGALDQAEAQEQADLAGRRTTTQNAYNANVQNIETAYNTDLAALNTDYETRKLGIQSAYDYDVAGANADVDAASLQAYIDQMNADRTYALQQAQVTGTLNGTPTLESLKYQQGETDKTRKEWIDTIGQYANDYQAQINAVQNDGDASNDWQIAYLNAARNQKIKEQEEKAAKTKQQDIENQQAWARINDSGSGGSSKPSTSINQQATQQVIAELLKHNDTGRNNLFNQYSSYWASQGVDLSKVMSAVGIY